MPSNEIERLIGYFAHLPTMGPRSARRAVLSLLENPELKMTPLIEALQNVKDHIHACPVCGNYDTTVPCSICKDTKRDSKQICVVRDIADLWALERSNSFHGLYHVLGGILSAIDGIGPEDLNIASLEKRIKEGLIDEVILALPATVDGQTTAHYVADRLSASQVKITSLARGVPIGGELDYLDDGTLQMALKSRRGL